MRAYGAGAPFYLNRIGEPSFNGLQCWIMADDLNVGDGVAIAAWDDRGHGISFAQATGTAQPACYDRPTAPATIWMQATCSLSATT
jgi:hypothetical protein